MVRFTIGPIGYE